MGQQCYVDTATACLIRLIVSVREDVLCADGMSNISLDAAAAWRDGPGM
jgi:hypothetical protein